MPPQNSVPSENQAPNPAAGPQVPPPNNAGGLSSQEKTAGILAYLVFFLPLIMTPESRFARFHANQGLALLILFLASMVIGIIPFLGWLVSFALVICGLIFIVKGMISASAGEMKELPLIGGLKLIS